MKKLNLILASVITLALVIGIACAGGVMTPAASRRLYPPNTIFQ